MAVHSYGGIVAVDWAAGTTYVALAEVVSFTPPELSITKSPGWNIAQAGAFKKKIPGMVDANDAPVMLRFTKAQYAAFITNLRTIGTWKLTASDTSYMTFSGFIATVGGPEHGDDDTVNQNISICPTTLPVWTSAA